VRRPPDSRRAIAFPFADVGTVPRTAIAVGPSIDATGVQLAVDAGVTVDGENAVEYLTTPGAAAPGMLAGVDGMGLAVADDLFNQLLAGAWGARLLEKNLPVHAGDATQIFFGADTDSLAVELSLPPTVGIGADGTITLQVGDVMVRALDEDGGLGTLAELALSFSVPLSIGVAADGSLTIELMEPQVWAQVITWSDVLPRALADEELEGLARTMFGQIGELASEALAGIPMPAIGGAQIDQASLDTSAGYMRVRAGLSAP